MGWFSRRGPRQPIDSTPLDVVSGVHRSPGLGQLCREMERHPPRAVLDLGSPSTENLRFLSDTGGNVSVGGLFRGASDSGGPWSALFRFEDVETLPLPESDAPFDVVFLWDLVHYFEPAVFAAFVGRLAPLCRPSTLVLLSASATAPIPLVPIHFKIESRETLRYQLPSDERAASPGLCTRDIEKLMRGFVPVRIFHLRNGLQEFLFRYEPLSPG